MFYEFSDYFYPLGININYDVERIDMNLRRLLADFGTP